ncbi:terpenoid synthase [Podospora australis]|uniref:Terpene synthase n=1 Tax=Podospora australis TaxID=1536484 RepID=A0AAN6WN19_9PEZI|nr:terpenoid synthase [Podospora australis]
MPSIIETTELAEDQQGQQWIRLPDILASWPWQRAINPHYEECKAVSDAWLQSFNVFTPKAQAAVNRCLLASLGFPTLSKEGNRAGCDLMNLFFVFDEKSDISSAEETKFQDDSIWQGILTASSYLTDNDETSTKPEWIGAEIAQQFWGRAILNGATERCQHRFKESFRRYLDSVVQQSADRDTGKIWDIKSYFSLRRETIGCYPSYALLEFSLDIPEEVSTHPTIRRLEDLATDMISIGNDLVSYNPEQARGDEGHNLLTVVMNQYPELSLQQAIDWIEVYHDGVVKEFLEYQMVASLFPGERKKVRDQLLQYADGLGQWPRSNDCWSFEVSVFYVLVLPRLLPRGLSCVDCADSDNYRMGRYFGVGGGLMVRENGGLIALLPKETEGHALDFVV